MSPLWWRSVPAPCPAELDPDDAPCCKDVEVAVLGGDHHPNGGDLWRCSDGHYGVVEEQPASGGERELIYLGPAWTDTDADGNDAETPLILGRDEALAFAMERPR